MKKLTNGFTIVELLVVMAVIGILTTLSTISFTRYQSDARDSQRSSKSTILAEALEKYYDKNGEYPGCTAMSNTNVSTVTTTVLPGVEKNTLLTPKSVVGDTNSIECTDITGAVGEADIFAYVGDGSAACNTGATCSGWTLKYKEEGTGEIKFIDSRRNATATSIGNISNLTATPTSLTQINLSWTAVGSIVDYTVQRATDSGFSANLVEVSAASNSSSATGLTAGTVYYFRVRANDALSSGNWSNVVSATTSQLATPVAVATVNSSSQITLSWNAIALAQSYTVEHSAASTFTSPTTITGIVTLNRAITGLTSGTTRYFRVKAVATADTSNWSATVSAAPTVNPPVATTTTAAMSGTNAVGTASAVTCAAGTTTQYQLQYRSTATATAGAWSAWSVWSTTRTLTVGALQGYQYTFVSHARCQAVSTASAATTTSAIDTIVRPITAPALPVLTSTTSGATTTFTWLAVACPTGTTVRYQWLYSNDAGYLGAWTAITTRVVTATTSTEGYSYTLQVKAQCYNTYATSAFGAIDITSYIRPVQMPDPITFSIARLSAGQVSLRASSTCNAGAVIFTTGDVFIYPPFYWSPSSPAGSDGWWNESHTTAWASDWISDWGWWTMPFQINPISTTGSFPSGLDWRIAVRMRCQNPSTNRASSATVTTYSPVLNTP